MRAYDEGSRWLDDPGGPPAVKTTALLTATLAALAMSGCGSGRAVVRSCDSQVRHAALPTWAHAGFSDPAAPMHYVLGGSGHIVAILFAYPLLSPPPKDHNNKILWVSRASRQPGSDLLIAGQRMTGEQSVGPRVTRTVIGGPGPSIIDLPSPGCWRLSLRWSGHSDQLDLHYAKAVGG